MASSHAWERGWNVASVSPQEAAPEIDLATLVDAHASLLFRVAHSILHNTAEAEDVVQDTFVRVLQRTHELNTIRDLRVWLIRIAWNLALDRRRRIRPDQIDDAFAHSLASSTAPADQALHNARHIAAVLAEIDRLPAAERHALLLSAIDDLSTPEIAAVLNRTEAAVRGLLFRARTHLRQRLEKGSRA